MSGSFKLLCAFQVAPALLNVAILVKSGASGWMLPSVLTFLSGPGVLQLGPGHYFFINDISMMHSILKC